MKRTLPIIVAAICLAGCMQSERPDDRALAMLQGSVAEVIPSAAGQTLRFDTLGRLIYDSRVDGNLNPTGEQTLFEYGTIEDGRTERIEIISQDGEMINRRRSAVSFDGKELTMQYFKIRISNGEKVFTDDKRIFKIHGRQIVGIKEPDGECTRFYYDGESAVLPCRMRVTHSDGTVSITEFEYPETDPQGNWLTRLSVKDGGRPVLESRMIKYYE